MDYKSEINYIAGVWKTQPKIATITIRRDKPELYAHISSIDGNTFAEKCWKFTNDSLLGGIVCDHCKTCQPKFLSYKLGYATYCTVKCQANSASTALKKRDTCFQKYNADHFSKTEEYKEKFKNTNLIKHGVENPGQIITNMERRSRKKQETFWNNLCEQIKLHTIPNHDFSTYTHVRDSTLEWKCILCNNLFRSHVFNKQPTCPECFPTARYGGQSNFEKEVLFEIRKFYYGVIEENARNVIAPKEIDIYFPQQKFGIECNGAYWHSDCNLPKTYHSLKAVQCEKSGIKLMMITDTEWHTKRDVILKMIKHRLGINKDVIIPARKCQTKLVTAKEVRTFLNSNHISGFCKGSLYSALIHQDSIVAVAVFGKNRFSHGNSEEVELIRFATSGNITGAMGKLLTFTLKTCNTINSVITYADLRYGTGNVYEKLGFTHIGDTKPGYWYHYNGTIYHRLSWTKQKLVNMGLDSKKTEHELMNEIGALRVYDCGHRKFKYTRR
jgi:hypothetical protein